VVVSNFSAKLLTSSFVMEPILRSLCEPFAPAATLPIVGGGGVEFAFEVVDARAAAVPSSSLLMRGDRSASASISPCARADACGNMDCNMDCAFALLLRKSAMASAPSWDMLFLYNFSTATCTSFCERVVNNRRTCSLPSPLLLKSISPQQFCNTLGPCSSRHPSKRL